MNRILLRKLHDSVISHQKLLNALQLPSGGGDLASFREHDKVVEILVEVKGEVDKPDKDGMDRVASCCPCMEHKSSQDLAREEGGCYHTE